MPGGDSVDGNRRGELHGERANEPLHGGLGDGVRQVSLGRVGSHQVGDENDPPAPALEHGRSFAGEKKTGPGIDGHGVVPHRFHCLLQRSPVEVRGRVNEKIEIADLAGRGPNELATLRRAGEIRGQNHGSPPQAFDLAGRAGGLLPGGSVVKDEIAAGPGQAKSDGSTHAHRGACDERRLPGQ